MVSSRRIHPRERLLIYDATADGGTVRSGLLDVGCWSRVEEAVVIWIQYNRSDEVENAAPNYF